MVLNLHAKKLERCKLAKAHLEEIVAEGPLGLGSSKLPWQRHPTEWPDAAAQCWFCLSNGLPFLCTKEEDVLCSLLSIYRWGATYRDRCPRPTYPLRLLH